ncbi:hypothetical protein ACQ7HM_05260 [Williamsia sp. MIQD14]|uniref:hypothetical protein n=1 Tax=Williamsia sp. MIQD14 TaxID=3425703 RepID=UPI003DA0F050
MRRRRHAVVFGPVQPAFDPVFFDPVTGWLGEQGYAVEILDSLAVVDDPMMTITDVADEWIRRRPDLAEVGLLCGNAFGGAVAQAMLPALPRDIAVLGLSAPTVADDRLAARLGDVAHHARMGNLAGALWTLDDFVRSEAMPAPARVATPVVADQNAACRRIELGMSLLTDLDVSAAVVAHTGPVLSIVGERSRLVTRSHARVPAHGATAVIPDAGMRPHRDNAAAVADVLAAQRAYLAGDADHAAPQHLPTHRIDTMGAA